MYADKFDSGRPPRSSTAQELELAALLCRVCGGCQGAFARLYELTSPRMLGIVTRIVIDRSEAEDVLQEVYVKVWNHCQLFDADKGQVGVWLAQISRHSAIDSLRRRHARPRGAPRTDEPDDDPYQGIVSHDPQPPECLQRKRRGEAVARSLLSLPMPAREAMVLAFFEGLHHTEIASRLGRPLGTVKSWISRSFADLQPVLADYR